MPPVFVDQQLAARLEDVQAWRAVCASQTQAYARDSALLMVAGAPVVYAGAGLPINRAIGLGMHGAVTADDLDAVEEFYRQRQRECLIDLCPLADPSLLSLLQARGYTIRNWMSMLFRPLPVAPLELNPAIHVTRATLDQAELWIETSARGFAESDHVDPTMLPLLTSNFYSTAAHCYFAWLDKTPIATGGMYLHNGVIELGGASTLVAYRQQGAQSALIQRRLEDAHALGYDLAAVLTSPGSASQRNMQRRGFELAYTRAICIREVAP